MKYIQDFSTYIGIKTGLDTKILFAIMLTIITLLVIKIIKICLRNILSPLEPRKAFSVYQKINIVLTIIDLFIIFIIWNRFLDNIITIISFVSAALTLALRDFVYNFFAGIYIKVKKPFAVEDRIEVDEIKGDVVSINALSFEVLEVGNDLNAGQSTGLIVNIPNSVALTSPLKNYEKNFKYIWSEIMVRSKIGVNIEETKKILLDIVNSNEVVKRIPCKMESEIEDISLDYRIYYNKLDPIIYCRVVETHVEFYIRYLVHPKKTRYVEDDIWSKILEAHKEGKIILDDGK